MGANLPAAARVHDGHLRLVGADAIQELTLVRRACPCLDVGWRGFLGYALGVERAIRLAIELLDFFDQSTCSAFWGGQSAWP